MALTIEDGSIVAAADSFVTVAEIRAYATKRGVDLPADDAEVEVLAQKAMDWFVAQEHELAGARVDKAQTLPYPRCGVRLYGFAVDEDEIPSLVKEIQMQASLDANSVDLLPTHAATPGGAIKKEVVDVLETEYHRPGASAIDFTPQLSKLDDLIKPLQAGRGLGLNVARA